MKQIILAGCFLLIYSCNPDKKFISNYENNTWIIENVVGGRATGKAGAYSDWDYVIEGINSCSWDKIKNSLPGARSILDNTPKNIDLFRGPLDPTKPYITIYPRP